MIHAREPSKRVSILSASGEATLRVTDSDHGAPGCTFLQYLSLLLLAVALHTAPVLAADSPFVFRDVASNAGLHEPLRGMMAHAAAWGDVNGDGLLDVLALAGLHGGDTLLFRNRGGMKFERSEAIPGDATGLGVAVGDITGNGWPDVIIGGPNRLFVNLGGGRFREAAELGLREDFSREDDSPSCGVALGDVDRDGDLDMLLGSHHKAPWARPNAIRLFRNLGSTPDQVRFEEITARAGIQKYPIKVPHVEIRDFDNDGWPDLYTAVVTMRGQGVYPAIYRNLGSSGGRPPKFQETAFVHRRDFPGPDDYIPGQRSDSFYQRLVANHKVMYFAPGPSGDFDNDGRLDLFLPSWWPELPSMLLRNETPTRHYLDVSVIGSGKINRMGIGSEVRAYRTGEAGKADALLAWEQIATGYGFCSAQPPVAHLGLGDTTVCDLVITLPHGRGKIVRENVQTDQPLTIQVE